MFRFLLHDTFTSNRYFLSSTSGTLYFFYLANLLSSDRFYSCYKTISSRNQNVDGGTHHAFTIQTFERSLYELKSNREIPNWHWLIGFCNPPVFSYSINLSCIRFQIVILTIYTLSHNFVRGNGKRFTFKSVLMMLATFQRRINIGSGIQRTPNNINRRCSML